MKHRTIHPKAHKHHHVGALSLKPKSTLVMLGSTALGYFFADQINAQIDKLLPAQPLPAPGTTASAFNLGTLVMVGEIGLGGMLLLGKGKASLLKTIPGGLLAGAGLKRALKKFGVITGYQAVPVIGKHRVAGYQAVPVIGGNTPAQLAGPAQLEGFRVNGYNPIGSGVGVMGGLYEGRGVYGDPARKSVFSEQSGSGISSDNTSSYMN